MKATNPWQHAQDNQIRREVIGLLRQIDSNLKLNPRSQNDTLICDTVRQVFFVDRPNILPMTLYRRVLNRQFRLRPQYEPTPESQPVVPPRESIALGEQGYHTQSMAMRQVQERARAAQPPIRSMGTNKAPDSPIAELLRRHTGTSAPVQPTDADRRNWGIA